MNIRTQLTSILLELSKDWIAIESAQERIEELMKNKWIDTDVELPTVDGSNDYNKKYKISRRVLTYSEEHGVRIGVYFHKISSWKIINHPTNDYIKVDYWMDFTLPEKKVQKSFTREEVVELINQFAKDFLSRNDLKYLEPSSVKSWLYKRGK